MTILGIETSCDETAAAVVENGRKIISNIVASSVKLHQKTGGIIPEVAAREQLKCIIPVVEESIKKTTGIKSIKSIDAIAVTVGPGLIGSLLVGVETAKTLAYVWQKPIIPINHLRAHLYANWLTPENKEPALPAGRHRTKCIIEIKFPAVGLVVSGGHTDLVLMKNHSQIKWLGGTRDDAAGECFDKCARLLGLGYPGGPAISRATKLLTIKHRPLAIKLPRPMINENNFDFSFSGLKTAVLNEIKKQKNLNIPLLAYEIQETITDVLVTKTKKAAEKYQIKSILLAGGVTANPRLREKMAKVLLGYDLFIPSPHLCTDNATFIASCAYFNFRPIPWQKLQANSSLEIEEMIK
jgi:N6-L-threonylcarbamoyladenine synthase